MSNFQNSGLNFGTSAPPHKNGGRVGGYMPDNKKGTNQRNSDPQTARPKRNHHSQFQDLPFIKDPEILEKTQDSGETLMTDRMKDLKNLNGKGFSCRFLIPAGTVGEIIGKKGKNINELQSMSGAGISMSKKPEFDSPERIQHVLK